MNLSEMRTFVRTQADTDETDATDAALEVYARAAYREIISRVFPWPDNRKNYSFTTVEETAQYLYSTFSPTDLEFIISVSSGTEQLNWISREEYLDLSVGSTATSSSPQFFAADTTSLYLWPTPGSAFTMTVNGYRSFASWPSGSTEPDLPRAFDEPICWFMLSKYYLAQEDLELAQMYDALFNDGVNSQIQSALRTSAASAGPRIFGGYGRDMISYESWVKRNTEG
jgi:hypothetical protein